MPLNTVPNPLELSSYEDINENFVIFYSSRDESGRMWCPVRWFPSLMASRVESLPRRPLGQRRETQARAGFREYVSDILLGPLQYQILAYVFRSYLFVCLFFSLSRTSCSSVSIATPATPATATAIRIAGMLKTSLRALLALPIVARPD